MKIFVDTANLHEIEETLKRGFVRGITTNPSLLAKEPKAAFEDYIRKIVELIQKHQPGIHLSVEVFSQDPVEILKQAEHFRNTFQYPELSIKIQVGWNELAVIRKLASEEFSVNCTCCMTVTQAVMAPAAGARYVSLFVGRIRDGGTDGKFEKERNELYERKVLTPGEAEPGVVLMLTRQLLDQSYPGVEIIAGSMRSVDDIKLSALNGAHIVTIPPKFFPDMISHFKTDEVVRQFLSEFKGWMRS